MDRGAWWATVQGVARVGYDLVTKTPPPEIKSEARPPDNFSPVLFSECLKDFDQG